MAFKWIGKSADGKEVTLKRLEESHFQFPPYFNSEWASAHADVIRTGAVLDVETTGLAHGQDKVIELGVRPFKFNRETGELLSLEQPYSSFQDPGEPITAEITALTGITDEMVKGHKIEWSEVDQCLSRCDILIAHNAGFDRPFIDGATTVSSGKIWGCSFRQVDWSKKGLTSQKLEVLAIFHGFFNDSHRALSDADSLLHLLSFKDEMTGFPYLRELLNQARKTTIHMMASNSPFESKDHLKNRNYRWDAAQKHWAKEIEKDLLNDEIKWLEETVYKGKFKGKYQEIAPADHYKANS